MAAKSKEKTTSELSRDEQVQQALEDEGVLEELIEQLGGTSRIKRQKASSVIAIVADEDASVLLPFAEDISEGLTRPEAQTRWETLHTLCQMGMAGQHYDDDVIAAAEDALYDEDSAIVRESAFHFFCGYGAASPENSDEVWPLIDEAIQCYHGNKEFSEMLTHLVAFAGGSISDEASAALAARMRFDSETASGTLRMRAEQIVAAYEARKS